MPRLPVIVKGECDELLYGWLTRLSDANGFSYLRAFVNAYIAPNSSESEKSRRVLKYDLLEVFENIYEALGLNISKADLFLRTGVFPYYALFMTEAQQADIIDETFLNNGKTSLSAVTKTKMISRLNLCPQCMQEDKKRIGRFYYHRAHQLPGVTVCEKHGCALRQYKGIPMHEGDENSRTEELATTERALPFAKYSKALLDMDVNANAEDLRSVLRMKLEALRLNKYEDFKSAVRADMTNCISEYDTGRLWKSIYKDAYFLSTENVVWLLMWLFPTTDELKTVLEKVHHDLPVNDALKQHHCTLLHKEDHGIMELRHDCGHVLCITRNEFLNGWSCPVCETSGEVLPSKQRNHKFDDDDFKKIIRDLTGDEYTLVGKFKDMNTRVDIRHNTCGNVADYIPSDFADGRRCKVCTQFLRTKELTKAITSLSDGRYQLGAKRTANLYSVIDTETGASRDLSSAKILQELRRPTPSPILPLSRKGNETKVVTNRGDVWEVIQQMFPHGTPIFLEDIEIEGKPYSVIKRSMQSIMQKKFVKPVCLGVYLYLDDDLSPDEIIYYRYIVRSGKHIGYYSGNNAMYELGIIKNKPEEYRIVTMKETSNNKTGRTTKFLDHKLRIRGSEIEITDDNWKTLMVLDLTTNLRKYIGGTDIDYDEAFLKIAQYVKENDIRQEDFSKYQGKYAFSYNFIKKLYTV